MTDNDDWEFQASNFAPPAEFADSEPVDIKPRTNLNINSNDNTEQDPNPLIKIKVGYIIEPCEKRIWVLSKKVAHVI